jgi:hypothetical protein
MEGVMDLGDDGSFGPSQVDWLDVPAPALRSCNGGQETWLSDRGRRIIYTS